MKCMGFVTETVMHKHEYALAAQPFRQLKRLPLNPF